jgi:hypothetical protein
MVCYTVAPGFLAAPYAAGSKHRAPSFLGLFTACDTG